MSEDRLEQALEEMRQEDRRCRDARCRARARLGQGDERRRCRLCGVPAGLPRLRQRNAGGQPARPDGRPSQPLPRVPRLDGRNEGRTAGDCHAAAVVGPAAMRWGTLAAAAALVLAVVYLGRGTIDAWLAPGGPRATVVSATGGLYRLPGGALEAGAAIGEKELVRTGPGAHAVLRLADGSTVDVNERTELFATAAWSGRAIHLQRGDVIVQAAKQRRGHLRVLTRDSIASVKGTVFAVSAGLGGSVVSVVEGSVAVNQPGTEVRPHPRPAGRLQPGAGEFGRGSRLLEPRGGSSPGAARLVREDRTPAGRHFSW